MRIFYSLFLGMALLCPLHTALGQSTTRTRQEEADDYMGNLDKSYVTSGMLYNSSSQMRRLIFSVLQEAPIREVNNSSVLVNFGARGGTKTLKLGGPRPTSVVLPIAKIKSDVFGS